MILLQNLYIGVILVVLTESLENLVQNMIYEGIASQSNPYSRNRWPANKAIDGNLQDQLGESTCSITTALYHKTAWWKFFFNQSNNVAYLQIFFRHGTVNRNTGFSVFVFNESSYIPPSSNGERVFTQDPSTCPNKVQNVTVNRLTKGLAIFNSKDPALITNCTEYEPSFATIEICEVMIIGCKAGAYAEGCKVCPSICPKQDCDAFNGSCRHQKQPVDGRTETLKTSTVVLATVSALVVVIIIIIALRVHYKRKQKYSHKKRYQEDTEPVGNLHLYDKIKKTEKENVYNKITLAVDVSVYQEIHI